MSLHKGMKFEYKKGIAKGRRGTILEVYGNDILVKTRKSKYWTTKHILEGKVKWLRRR